MGTITPAAGTARLAGDKAAPAAQPYWNPYLAGIGLGLVLLASFVIMGRGLGASGAFSSLIATGVQVAAPEHAARNHYFAEYLGDGTKSPLADWLVFEVLGVFAGGFLSGALAGRLRRTVEKGPRISVAGRLGFAFGGGMLMGIGAKLARGCTEWPGADRRRAARRWQLGVHAVRVCRSVCAGLFF